jgi:hypothetical protein
LGDVGDVVVGEFGGAMIFETRRLAGSYEQKCLEMAVDARGLNNRPWPLLSRNEQRPQSGRWGCASFL